MGGLSSYWVYRHLGNLTPADLPVPVYARLVVVDSRAARVLDPDRCSMLDEAEMAWLDERRTGYVDHLFIGTSLPFLLSAGLHDVEAIDEVLAEGVHGRVLIASHSKRVPDPAYPWLVTDGPWFDNCLAEITVQRPDRAIAWRGGVVRDGDDAHPQLTTVASVRIPGAP